MRSGPARKLQPRCFYAPSIRARVVARPTEPGERAARRALPTPARARAQGTPRDDDPARASGRGPQGRTRAPRPLAVRASRRRPQPRSARGGADRAPSRPRRASGRCRRRRSPREQTRRKAAVLGTRRSDESARRPASRSARRAAAPLARGCRDSHRRTRFRSFRTRRSDEEGEDRAQHRRYRPICHEIVTASCQDGASRYSSKDVANSSRSGSRAASRSAGVLIGMNRPRGPERGTTRYVVGTNAVSSW